MAYLLFIRILALGSSIISTSASGAPFQVSPSVKQYGPDGPWYAASVAIGSPGQPIDLFPGGNSASYVMNQQNCSHTLLCGAGGLYNRNNSDTSYNVLEGNSYYDEPISFGSIIYNATADGILDILTLSGPSTPTTDGALLRTVNNFTLWVLSDLNMTIGNGANYPLQAGRLSLGPPDSQTTSIGNGSVIPKALEMQRDIPSNSYGLHYGSANLNQPLSLWLGGYDQQRLVGPVSTQHVDSQFNLPIDLLDIGIGVVTGGSPFSFPSQTGLLATKNASIGSQLPVYMYPGAPYLNLPNSTCNAIASLLPVTYNYTLGLYLWNTASPSYNPIKISPAYLSFTFRASTSSTANLTINIPFSL